MALQNGAPLIDGENKTASVSFEKSHRASAIDNLQQRVKPNLFHDALLVGEPA